MDSDYPPLPPTRGPGPESASASPIQALPLRNGKPITPSVSSEEVQLRESASKKGHSQQSVNVISSSGDVIVEYADRGPDVFPASSTSGPFRWLVASGDLIRNSPYFRALLDPNKFSEGRNFMKQKTDLGLKTAAAELGTKGDENATERSLSLLPSLLSFDTGALNALPTLSLQVDQFTRTLGVDAIELFLRVLSFQSLDDDDQKRQSFDAEIKILPPSLIARLVELADAFNSPQVVQKTLKRSGYTFGKGRVPVTKFNQSLLRMSEDRIRQITYIAQFLNELSVFQALTHTLVVLGSRYWVNGVEAPDPEVSTFRWQYFTDGLEEELFHRRQYVLNTITDLQAYFLRAYGALEETTGPKPSTTNHPITVPATSTTIRPRDFQCRCGMGNSNACDAFHLGQMVRFFALRTKTIFLGSSLLDPDFTADSDDEDTPPTTVPGGPPTDITAIIASLKQFPDYQIDSNHTGCGVRRRIIPALDCIERFVGDGRGLLGVSLRLGNNGNRVPLSAGSWTNRSLRRAQRIDIRFSRISSIQYARPSESSRSASQEEDARLFFTARKRHWES